MEIAIDTLSIVRKLIAGGYTREQAEAQADVFSEFIGTKLATKRDILELQIATQHEMQELKTATQHEIQGLRTANKRDIQELRTDTKRDIQEMEYRLTIRLGTMLVIAVGTVATLVKLI